eukprot:g50219.t1
MVSLDSSYTGMLWALAFFSLFGVASNILVLAFLRQVKKFRTNSIFRLLIGQVSCELGTAIAFCAHCFVAVLYPDGIQAEGVGCTISSMALISCGFASLLHLALMAVQRMRYVLRAATPQRYHLPIQQASRLTLYAWLGGIALGVYANLLFPPKPVANYVFCGVQLGQYAIAIPYAACVVVCMLLLLVTSVRIYRCIAAANPSMPQQTKIIIESASIPSSSSASSSSSSSSSSAASGLAAPSGASPDKNRVDNSRSLDDSGQANLVNPDPLAMSLSKSYLTVEKDGERPQFTSGLKRFSEMSNKWGKRLSNLNATNVIPEEKSNGHDTARKGKVSKEDKHDSHRNRLARQTGINLIFLVILFYICSAPMVASAISAQFFENLYVDMVLFFVSVWARLLWLLTSPFVMTLASKSVRREFLRFQWLLPQRDHKKLYSTAPSASGDRRGRPPQVQTGPSDNDDDLLIEGEDDTPKPGHSNAASVSLSVGAGDTPKSPSRGHSSVSPDLDQVPDMMSLSSQSLSVKPWSMRHMRTMSSNVKSSTQLPPDSRSDNVSMTAAEVAALQGLDTTVEEDLAALFERQEKRNRMLVMLQEKRMQEESRQLEERLTLQKIKENKRREARERKADISNNNALFRRMPSSPKLGSVSPMPTVGSVSPDTQESALRGQSSEALLGSSEALPTLSVSPSPTTFKSGFSSLMDRVSPRHKPALAKDTPLSSASNSGRSSEAGPMATSTRSLRSEAQARETAVFTEEEVPSVPHWMRGISMEPAEAEESPT